MTINNKQSITEVNDIKSTTKDLKKHESKTHPTVYIVFSSLLLDLLAFTMILPLLPSLLDHYQKNDSPNGLYPWLLNKVQYFQRILGAPDKFNSVLFGGFLGSMFSFLQFIVTPIVGAFSDVYGRKPVLLCCLIGISLSYAVWAVSRTFALFVVARFLGGISKGNVSLSLAIITDVSTPTTRGIGMALIGIAFSVGFIVGPVIGAMFAKWAQTRGNQTDWFVVPALFAFLLCVADIIFVYCCFKESLPKEKRAKKVASSLQQALSYVSIPALFKFSAVYKLPQKDMQELQLLGLVYFVYLFLYSGLEFTLTFLTHHTFQFTSMQQGWMFFCMGLTMALIQGSWIRHIPIEAARKTATRGLLLTVPSYLCVGLAPSPPLLYFGLFLYAVSTAMVVPCMMTLASQFGSPAQKGTAMGIFRSLGALARAVGPILASLAYWSIGSTMTYCLGAIGLLWPWYSLYRSCHQKTS